jgi:hypothetical protein
MKKFSRGTSGVYTAARRGCSSTTESRSYPTYSRRTAPFFCSTWTGGPQAVVVFLVVAAAGAGEVFFFCTEFDDIVDKFRTVIAVKFQNREEDGVFDVHHCPESPGMGVIEEGT